MLLLKRQITLSDLSVPTKQVLIRCDGSSLVGFGHLVRCLALADELRDSTSAHIAFASLEGASVVNEKGYLTYHPHTIEKILMRESGLRV